MNTEMEKHTPGPLTAYEKVGEYEIVDSEFNSCLQKGEVGEDVAHANAVLYASAPSLLSENKKLRERMQILERGLVMVCQTTDSDDVLNIAESALAKQALTIK